MDGPAEFGRPTNSAAQSKPDSPHLESLDPKLFPGPVVTPRRTWTIPPRLVVRLVNAPGGRGQRA
jgi:hypothetical protein